MGRRRGRGRGRAGRRESMGGGLVLAVVVGLVVLASGGYAAAYAAADGDVPRGVSVAGVAIGGLKPDVAEQVLRDGLAERASRGIEVVAGGQRAVVDPARAGLAIDYAATVAAAGGDRSWHPMDLWEHYTGGARLAPVVTTDGAAMAGVLDRLDQRFGSDPSDGGVSFTATAKVVVTEPAPGEAVDREAAAAALEDAWLGRREAPVEVALVDVDPDIDADDVQDALDQVANPAVSGPVTLVFGSTPVRLTPRDYVGVLSLAPYDGRLVPLVDRPALQRLLGGVVGEKNAPVDASFEIVGGTPRVVPAKPGADYDEQQVARSFLGLVKRRPGDRRLQVEASVVPPDLTTKEARALGVTEKVSEFETSYPDADYRNTNLGRAAELIDGTLLEPGEVFSMNDVVGERTRANGFTEGFIISDGILTEDLGGGVSQMATTLFNAMFFAGLEDVEHRPHSFYISRYPVGREATVVFGALDLAFRNDTDHGVLVTATVTPSTSGSEGVVNVSMWSTKVWDIGSVTSDRSNFTEESVRRLSGPDCEPHSGYGGFDVDVTRVFRRPGESAVVRREVFSTTYTPADTVICE